jgi:N-acetylmuramoyl-L-alanine amidase
MELTIKRQAVRRIDNIVIHCTATSNTAKISSILNYWKTSLGWKNVGYHIIVENKGNSVRLAEDTQITNGVGGHNRNSIHICYIGGLNGKDTRSPEQKAKLIYLVKKYKEIYPNAKVLGHRDFKGVKKECPCFNAIKEYENI